MKRSDFFRLAAATPFAFFLPKPEKKGYTFTTDWGKIQREAIQDIVEPYMGYRPQLAEWVKLSDDFPIDIRGGGPLETGYAEKYLLRVMDNRGVTHRKTVLVGHGIRRSSSKAEYRSELAYQVLSRAREIGRHISITNREGPFYIEQRDLGMVDYSTKRQIKENIGFYGVFPISSVYSL